jgi:hypothetical protein
LATVLKLTLTLIEPDFDLDNDGAQSLTLDLIEWDSDANLIVATNALRGTTATFNYNDSAQSFLVANDFGN